MLRNYWLAMNCSAPPHLASRPRGLTAIGVFLLFGAVMAFIAGASLLRRGTILDRTWTLNPHAYDELSRLGKPVGLLFMLLAVALALAGMGWLKRRWWGWRLAVVIIGTQVLGDFANIFSGRVAQGAVGATIASALLFYITRAQVRAVFRVKAKQVVHVHNP